MSTSGSGRFPETARLVLTLTVAGFLSGLVIVSVDAWTAPRIAAHKAAALRQAVFEVLPGAERMEPRVWRDGVLEAEEENGVAAGEPTVYAGFRSSGELVGFAIPGEGGGYQDTIELIYGYDAARGRVVGLRVLASRETPGLGDRIYKDQAFVDSFRDLAVAPEIVLVKGETGADNEVAGLTGATISSQAVVRIVNQANERWLGRLEAPAHPGGPPPPEIPPRSPLFQRGEAEPPPGPEPHHPPGILPPPPPPSETSPPATGDQR